MPDISRLRADNFYVAIEGEAFHRIVAPWCLSYHPPNPLSPEEVVALAKSTPGLIESLRGARACFKHQQLRTL